MSLYNIFNKACNTIIKKAIQSILEPLLSSGDETSEAMESAKEVCEQLLTASEHPPGTRANIPDTDLFPPHALAEIRKMLDRVEGLEARSVFILYEEPQAEASVAKKPQESPPARLYLDIRKIEDGTTMLTLFREPQAQSSEYIPNAMSFSCHSGSLLNRRRLESLQFQKKAPDFRYLLRPTALAFMNPADGYLNNLMPFVGDRPQFISAAMAAALNHVMDAGNLVSMEETALPRYRLVRSPGL